MFVRGMWLGSASCDLPDQPVAGIADVIGVDLGLVNLAVDDRDVSFSGEPIEEVRRRHHTRRRALQKKRTRCAKHALRRASGGQARYRRLTNHVIAKAIGADAERDRCMIALEGLAGIRNRVQANRHQRARVANWGFAEMRSLIEYKAALRGIPVVLIDPRHTSQPCGCCGLIERRHRPNRDTFQCIGRGFAASADHNAARVIRQRGMLATSFVMALEGATPGLLVVSPRESRLLELTVHYGRWNAKLSTVSPGPNAIAIPSPTLVALRRMRSSTNISVTDDMLPKPRSTAREWLSASGGN